MGWGSFISNIVDTVHDATKYLDPGTHYALDLTHDTSTKLVNETSRGIENIFGKDTALGGLGEHWKNMSQKDKDDFGRWLTNTGLSAGAVYGGMTAAGGGGAGGAAAGAGEAGAAGSGYVGVGSSGAAGAGGGAAGAAGAAGGGGVAAAGGGAGWYGQAANTAAGLYSTYLQSKAASDAADAQSGAANAATAEQRRQFDISQINQAPYIKAGGAAVTKLGDLLGIGPNSSSTGYGSLVKPFTGESVATDPGYQFGLDQGMKALKNNAAASGGLYSGATLKAVPQYATDYATTKFNDAFNRNQATNDSTFNKLSGVAGTGQTSSSQLGSLGANMANQIGGNIIGAGNAQAANALAQGNLAGNVVGQIGSYAKNFQWPTSWGSSGSTAASAGSALDNVDYGQYFADGGPVRKEPKVGTRSPLPGGGGGGLSREAVAAAMDQKPEDKPAELPVNRRVLPRQTAEGLAAIEKYKRGGSVKGPGGPKDDDVPAMLSNGEHVVTADEVSALGQGDNELGQMRMARLRKALKQYGKAA